MNTLLKAYRKRQSIRMTKSQDTEKEEAAVAQYRLKMENLSNK